MDLISTSWVPVLNLPVWNGLFTWPVVMLLTVAFFLKMLQWPAGTEPKQIKTDWWTRWIQYSIMQILCVDVSLRTDSKPSDKSSSQTRHLMVLPSCDLLAKQVCSQLHDKVIGGNTTIHPEREGTKDKALSYTAAHFTGRVREKHEVDMWWIANKNWRSKVHESPLW